MNDLISRAERVQKRYAAGASRPLAGYLASMGGYAATVAGLALLGRLSGRRLPQRVRLGDVVLIGVATQKVSRIVAKGTITSPLRAPFTQFEGPAGASEVNEKVKGEGVRHALGELVTCPFCVGVWVATFFGAGMVFSPRLTRLAAATFSAVAISDLLQVQYGKVKHEAETESDHASLSSEPPTERLLPGDGRRRRTHHGDLPAGSGR